MRNQQSTRPQLVASSTYYSKCVKLENAIATLSTRYIRNICVP